MMTLRLSLLAGCCLLAGLTFAAEESASARALLDRAIVAMGGDKLLQPPALTGTGRGQVTAGENTSKVSNEWTVQGLDQLKWVTTINLNENPANFTVIINRDKGWLQGGDGTPNPIDKDQLKVFLPLFAALRICESPLPLRGKEWKLSSLGEIKLDEKPAIGIKATRKGQPDLDIFFDKATHLPAKAEMRVVEPGSSMEVAYVARFTAYKKVNGRQFFTRLVVTRDDKEVMNMERADFQPKDKLDESTFAKP